LEQQGAILKEYHKNALMIKCQPKQREPDAPQMTLKQDDQRLRLFNLLVKKKAEKMRKEEYVKIR